MFGGSTKQLAWRLMLDDETLALVTVAVDPFHVGKLNLVVDPRVRRRGVGSAVVRELVKQPEIKSLRGLEGEVPASNVAAQKILIKNGFAKTGQSLNGNVLFRLA